MQSVTKRLAVLIMAVLALTAVTAASAVASPEWYAKRSGAWAKITTPVKVASAGTLQLSDLDGGPLKEPVTFSCTVTTGGAVGAGSSGEIAEIKGFSSENCKCKSGCEKIEQGGWSNLPAPMELYKEGTEIRARVTASKNLGTPYFTFTYKQLLGGLRNEDACNFNTSTKLTNTSGGSVEATFGKGSNKTHCLAGGNESGEWNGALTIKANQSGVEAIKVE